MDDFANLAAAVGARNVRRGPLSYEEVLNLPNERFSHLYVISKEDAEEIRNALLPFVQETNPPSSLSFEIRFLVALSFLAQGEDFVLETQEEKEAVAEVCGLMATHLKDKYIVFPTTTEDVRKTRERYYWKHNTSDGILGGIDVFRVRIRSVPEQDVKKYYTNKKDKLAINVLIASNDENYITYVDASQPGKCTRPLVWKRSTLRSYMERVYSKPDNRIFLMANDIFPLEPWLMTGIKKPVNKREVNYNDLQKSVNHDVKYAFKSVRYNVKCLADNMQPLDFHPVDAGNIVISCCIMNNIRKMKNPNVHVYGHNISINSVPQCGLLIPQWQLPSVAENIRKDVLHRMYPIPYTDEESDAANDTEYSD